MSVMKIGGKAPDNTVKGILVETDGMLKTTKTWQTDRKTVVSNSNIISTEAFTNLSTPVDLSECGIVGLRVRYQMPEAATVVTLYDDQTEESSMWMHRPDGGMVSFTIPASSEEIVMMFTAEDLPFLPYLKYLKVRVAPQSVPTSAGKVTIWAITKR